MREFFRRAEYPASPRARARDIIERCAHPHFRPLLREYLALALAGGGDEPHMSRPDYLDGWRRSYDAACQQFPGAAPGAAA